MSVIVPVVEGHGEVESVPVLIRRYHAHANPPIGLEVRRPVRVGRSKVVKQGELERAIRLASYQGDAVIVLVDADDDCPATLAPALLERARSVHELSSVVLAKSEFEAWLIGAADSIRGTRGLRSDLTPPPDAENIRDAKGWLSDRMSKPANAYSSSVDQAALTATFDFAVARQACPSLDKFFRELDGLFSMM